MISKNIQLREDSVIPAGIHTRLSASRPLGSCKPVPDRFVPEPLDRVSDPLEHKVNPGPGMVCVNATLLD